MHGNWTMSTFQVCVVKLFETGFFFYCFSSVKGNQTKINYLLQFFTVHYSLWGFGWLKERWVFSLQPSLISFSSFIVWTDHFCFFPLPPCSYTNQQMEVMSLHVKSLHYYYCLFHYHESIFKMFNTHWCTRFYQSIIFIFNITFSVFGVIYYK